jgi:hypothetical protein
MNCAWMPPTRGWGCGEQATDGRFCAAHAKMDRERFAEGLADLVKIVNPKLPQAEKEGGCA